jgi:replicative DNA helicase
MGKTAFMLKMALNQLKDGITVFFFRLEMSRAIMMARLVSLDLVLSCWISSSGG